MQYKGYSRLGGYLICFQLVTNLLGFKKVGMISLEKLFENRHYKIIELLYGSTDKKLTIHFHTVWTNPQLFCLRGLNHQPKISKKEGLTDSQFLEGVCWGKSWWLFPGTRLLFLHKKINRNLKYLMIADLIVSLGKRGCVSEDGLIPQCTLCFDIQSLRKTYKYTKINNMAFLQNISFIIYITKIWLIQTCSSIKENIKIDQIF